MQNSSRHVANAVTDTVKINHDDQRGLMQAGFSDNKRQIQRVVASLENLENLITTSSPQAPNGHLSGELLAVFLILSCFCWHR
jgi:glutaredoxin 2